MPGRFSARSDVCQVRAGIAAAKCTACCPVPLPISSTCLRPAKWRFSTWRMGSRLRSQAGAWGFWGCDMRNGRDRTGTASARRGAEQLERVMAHTLEIEQAKLGDDPAGRRETARLAARGDHAMAWHDDRNGIASERSTHGARRIRLTELLGHLAIGERRSGSDGARHLIDANVKRRQILEVEHQGVH